jgi:hypothetical protein
VRGFWLTASGFTAETDWLLEGTGFELSVPGEEKPILRDGFVPILSATSPSERDRRFEFVSLRQSMRLL